MEEKTVLAAIRGSQSAYRKIEQYIEDGDFSDMGTLLLTEYREFYNRDTKATEVDLDVLQSVLERKYPKHSEKLLAVAATPAISPDNILTEYFEHKRSVVGVELGQLLLQGKPADELIEKYEKYSNAVETVDFDEDKVFIGLGAETLVEHLSADNLLRVYPDTLNDRLGGGVPPATHIIMYALPEVGKTASAINMACGWARDNKKVLYIGNEDPYKLMLMRIMSRLSMMNRDEVKANPGRAMERALANGYENIVFASLAPGSLSDVRRLMEKYEPDAVVTDQIHNLHSQKRLSKVEHLEYVAKTIRDFGKECDAVMLSLTQAADTATNKIFPDMGDVYYSNVAIQAAADVMIGQGMSADGQRGFSLPKNKVSGNHEPFPINLDPYLSRIT